MLSMFQGTPVCTGGRLTTLPRISIMEDYTVYRDLSHLDSLGTQPEYFSISQLPKELQGLSIVPYSPGFDTMDSQKRRHISLV